MTAQVSLRQAGETEWEMFDVLHAPIAGQTRMVVKRADRDPDEEFEFEYRNGFWFEINDCQVAWEEGVWFWPAPYPQVG